MVNSIQPKELDTIKAYIERAKNALSDAKFNLDDTRLMIAQNRIYYACFYIVKSFVETIEKHILERIDK